MRKITPLLLSLFLGLTLSGCAEITSRITQDDRLPAPGDTPPMLAVKHSHKATPPLTPPTTIQAKKRLETPNFNAVAYQGPFKLIINGNQSRNRVTISGDTDLVDAVKAQATDGILYLSADRKAVGALASHVVINIDTKKNSLTMIETHASGNVIAKNLQGNKLDVHALGQGDLTITGKNIALKQLEDTGDGKVTIHNIVTKGLAVNASNSQPLELSGKIALEELTYNGQGSLTISGIQSHDLIATIGGSGTVKLNGDVGLQKLTHTGSSKVTLSNASGNNVLVNAASTGSLTFIGKIGISQINDNGSGYVDIRWLNSDNLTISGNGSSRMSVAGKTNKLYVKLTHKAAIDAKHLTAKQAYIDTRDRTRADVLATQSLNALAADASNIYYYGKPKQLARYVDGGGTVLRM